VLPLLRAAPEDVAGARSFVLGNIPGMFFFVAFIATKTFLQAHGKIVPLLFAAFVSNVVNWIACNMLVRGDDALVAWRLPPMGLPHLGAFGAGLANSIATAVLFLISMLAAYKYRATGNNPAASVRRILELGVPMGLMFLAEIGAFTTASMLAAWFGPAQVAAYQVALILASQTFMGALGVSGATAVQVGKAIGEGTDPREAGFMGITIGALFMLVGVAMFTLFPKALVSYFTQDPEVIRLGTKLLQIAAIFQLFDGVQCVAAGALRGAGDAKVPFWINLGAHWGLGLPVALSLGFGLNWGVTGFFVGLTIGIGSVAIALFMRFNTLSKTKIARVV
jgi:multidrug resistance protein, MATE family